MMLEACSRAKIIHMLDELVISSTIISILLGNNGKKLNVRTTYQNELDLDVQDILSALL